MRAITRDSTPARRKGIEVATTTICPLPPRKQKGHAHHSHPHASLTGKDKANKSIESTIFALPPSLGEIHPRWESRERQPLILCVGIKVVTTTHVPFALYPPRKQKGHAHHSHPHASLTSANKSIESFLHYHSRWERYRRRGNP